MKLHLDEVYTTLKIVSRPKRSVYCEGSVIGLGNLFGSKGEYSMALAEGSPGIGKTTLCLKLAYDWANQSMPCTFPAFELVLLLKCKDLDGDIMEAIFEQLLPEDMEEKTKERLLNFITDIHSQERILIILDGLDEVPKKSEHRMDKLLNRRVLPSCYMLATTRQEKGIEARKQFAFDICLQIEGFTEEDSFQYIRKHFKNIDPSKGARLIEETKENTLLHALRNNPLNLLLLCVVYEEYEGKLPSSRTDLFQIIVRCLLRRYCEKNSVKACEEDSDLEKQFEANILVLGELAWECLLNDRHSFREDQLTKLERSDDKLVVRYLGLVFKEESLKRLKPNHEYFFLHKSFQEYLAAFYIAHKLRRNQFNVFEHVQFDWVVKKFSQVFLFVCGILREEAHILFTQIGEKLKRNWKWLTCGREEANFFVESFSESGNPELMAATLFSFIPFPRVVHLSLFFASEGLDLHGDWNIVKVLRACTGFSKVQTPEVYLEMPCDVFRYRFLQLQCLPKLKNLDICNKCFDFKGREVGDDWDTVAEHLKASKTLEKVTFTLWNELSDGWARALGAGLCADTPLSSVGLRIHGSLSQTAIKALESLLHNKSLSSLSIYICGDMQDSLAVALATGLAGQIAVKVLDLCVNGKLSLYGANLIERGIAKNNSLTKLIVSLRGEVPDNWQTVGRNIYSRLRRETSGSCALYPDTFSKVTTIQVQRLCPFEITDGLPVQQNVTLNIWGKLGRDGADALHENLLCSRLSNLKLGIHGKLTNGILNSAARWVDERNTLSSLTINTWEELSKGEKTIFEDLKLDKNPAVTLNVRDIPGPPEESRDNEFVSADDVESLLALFKEARNTGKQNLNVSFNVNNVVLAIKETLNNSDLGNGMDAGAARNTPLISRTPESIKCNNFNREWEDGLRQVLASNTTLNDLSLTFSDNDNMVFSLVFLLGDGLARNTSLRNLTLTMNSHGVTGHTWRDSLRYGLERNTSLKSFSLIIENHSNRWIEDIIFVRNTSVENLSLTVNNHARLDSTLVNSLRLDDVLTGNNSLKSLTLKIQNFDVMMLAVEEYKLWENNSLNDFSLTINNYGNIMGDESNFAKLLCQLKSLTTLNLTLNLCGKGGERILPCLLEKAMESESLKTLRLKINDRQITNGSRGYDFSEFVVESPSLSLIELTVSLYGGEESWRK